MSLSIHQALVDVVYHEARCIDEQRWDEWLALYTDDAHYWMPLTHGQTDPLLQGSLMYEDKMLLGIRVERLKGRPLSPREEAFLREVQGTGEPTASAVRVYSSATNRRMHVALSQCEVPGRRTRKANPHS